MTEEQFKSAHGSRWKAFADLLLKNRFRRFPEAEATLSFPRAYRKLCRDLNQARARQYSPALVEDLNRLVWEGHQILYGSRRDTGSLWTLAAAFPQAVRRFWVLFLICHGLFYGSAAAAWLYVQSSPVRAETLLGPETIAQYQNMYDPEAEHFLKPRGVTDDADMFGFYINNNLTIGFRTFAAGALAGIGSLAFVVFNGVALGGAAGVVVEAGYSQTFFPFVAGHGSFELTAILLFAVAGFRLGGALVRPGIRSRTEALRQSGKEVFPLVAGAAVFLFLAACLEAFWSSRPLDPVWKYSVAAGLWLFVYGFLLLGGRRGTR